MHSWFSQRPLTPSNLRGGASYICLYGGVGSAIRTTAGMAERRHIWTSLLRCTDTLVIRWIRGLNIFRGDSWDSWFYIVRGLKIFVVFSWSRQVWRMPVGISYDFNGLTLDMRIASSITKTMKHNDLHNAYAQLTVGYKFTLK